MELGTVVGVKLPFSHPRTVTKDGEEDVVCTV